MRSALKSGLIFVLLLGGANSGVAQSLVQWIHNAADDALATVDIYVNDVLIWDNAAFRTAKPYELMNAGALNVAVAPGNSTSSDDALWKDIVSIPDQDTVSIIASGVLDPKAHTPNPDKLDTDFTFLVNSDVQVYTLPGFFFPIIVHGITDAPALTGIVLLTGTLLPVGSYGSHGPFHIFPFPGMPTALGALGPLRINFFAEPNMATIVAEISLPLAGYEGDAAVIIASGFLDPGTNKTQALPINFYAVFPDGTVERLSNNTPFPVELTEFTATVDGSRIHLDWTTATENNNAGFDVEISTNAHDFIKVGTVEGAGTTMEAQHYRFVYEAPMPGRILIRLRQIDFDGRFEYSHTIEARVDVPDTHFMLPAYPNPFNPSTLLTLVVARAQHVHLEIFDARGRHVRTLHDGILSKNRQYNFRFDADALPGGLYMIRATGENFVESQQVMLVK